MRPNNVSVKLAQIQKAGKTFYRSIFVDDTFYSDNISLFLLYKYVPNIYHSTYTYFLISHYRCIFIINIFLIQRVLRRNSFFSLLWQLRVSFFSQLSFYYRHFLKRTDDKMQRCIPLMHPLRILSTTKNSLYIHTHSMEVCTLTY